MAEISKEEKRILIILGGLLLLGMAFYFLTHLPTSQNIDTETIFDTPTANSTCPSEDIYIHISGAVKDPGVYKLPATARVWEALSAAGGPLSSADLDKVNLTKILADQEKIQIVYKENTGPLGGDTRIKLDRSAQAAGADKVNLNTAAPAELDALPRVGPALVKRIIEYREKQPFQTIDDIRKVKGFGPKMFEKIKDRLTV